MSIFLNGIEYGGPQPIATPSQLGVSKPDDSTIKIDANGVIYVNGVQAAKISYDNATSQLAAAQVQAAIDEIVTRINSAEGRLTSAESRLTAAEGRLTAIEAALERTLIVETGN